ncbi:MAG: methylmalonyl Co-A mutase-associated GTPase MeaB [Candidatus Lokiarchaeota archaeon]|nr:methylmalonyl Co-A mutase-associated GTPase MeaB [Candidatus Lokiarchaeota archaeon]
MMKREYDIDQLVERFKKKDKQALSRLISIVENYPDLTKEVFTKLNSAGKKSYIVGITGPPGAGKSTLINMIAKNIVDQGKSIGVVSVDPTSPFSGGALLGDRIRMKNVILHPDIFIRSLASRGMVGGLSRAVFDICRLFEAYGKDLIIIETVGAGQSEIDVFKFAYTIIVVSVPGYGDSIQVQKAGIIEIADILVVNKYDLGGDDILAQLEIMLDDASDHGTGWRPPVVPTNGVTGEGIDELVNEIWNHKQHMELSGLLDQKKKDQIKTKIIELLYYNLEKYIRENIASEEKLDEIAQQIAELKSNVYEPTEKILEELFKRLEY